MMMKTARENGVDPNELKLISDRGSAIIKCLVGSHTSTALFTSPTILSNM